EALIKRGENVVAVYVAPEKPGQKADPLKEAAVAAKLPVYQPASYRKPEVWEEFKALKPDLQVMAFVTLFVPEEFLNIPTHGSIQYHPSLLPAYRGPSAINWPIIKGDAETGLSIFWPDNGLDTGDVLVQKKTPIGPSDTLGTVYFDRLFPMGVDAMMESVDLVKAGKAPRIKQDESLATYEGRCGPDNARIDWGKPWIQIDRLIRGCNPAPGAWTTLDGATLKIFDAKPLPAKDPKGIAGKMGEIVAVEADGFTVVCADGRFKVTRVQPADGKKIDAGEWAGGAKLAAGARFASFLRHRPSNPCVTSTRPERNLPCPPPSIKIRNPILKSRRLRRSGRSSTSPRTSSGSRRKTSNPTATTRPRCRWTTSNRCRARRTE